MKQLALEYLMRAIALCPTDPQVHHEIGIIHFKNNQYL